MKRGTFGLGVCLVLALHVAGVAQTRPDFSGTWELNQAKSNLRVGGNGQIVPFATQLIVKQTDADLHLDTRSVRQESFAAAFKLDGSTVSITAPPGIMETGAARIDGRTLVITSRRSFASPLGETVVTFKEVWTLDGNALTVEKTRTDDVGSATERAVYDRGTAGGARAERASVGNESAPGPSAGPIPRRPDGKPDLTGRWTGMPANVPPGMLPNSVILEAHSGGFGITAGRSLIIDPNDGIIPYQPWALVERNRRRQEVNAYEDQVGHCEFYEVGRLGASFASDFRHASNGDIIIDASQHITRVIAMNRRQHLPDGIRLWLGDAIGWWEGDTLVVDIANLNAKGRMAIGGDFYSANAHLVERWTMKNANMMEWTLTITDPTVFTRPWTMTSPSPMRRLRQTENFDAEDTCHEGNVDLVHLKNVYDQAHGSKAPWPPVYPTGSGGSR
jgi:hypothetical protein